MFQKTLSYYITMLYRSFSAFTGERLQKVELNFGLLFFYRIYRKKAGLHSVGADPKFGA